MKINAIRAFIIAAIVIILLYALGLFLPIIMTSKSTWIKSFENNLVLEYHNKYNVFQTGNTCNCISSFTYLLFCNQNRSRQK